MKENEKNVDIDIFDSIDAQSETLGFLDKKSGAMDGIYRPKITDKKKGYIATIRFLPNLSRDGKVLQSAIEKHQHYVDFKNHPELAGYYDCAKNLTDKCDMCTMYWKLHNSKNATEVEKAELISRSTKYYSYILVIEDEQNRDLEGKIMIYPYGYKIKEKIKDQKDGTAGDPCNVFDLANGRNFKLVIKQLGEYPNYDSSTFMDISPIMVQGRKVPVEIDEKTGKNKITNPKAKKMITDMLMERTVNLEDHIAKEWTSEEKYKVSQILEILSGNDIQNTQKIASKGESFSTKEPDDEATFGENDDAGDFFELSDNE